MCLKYQVPINLINDWTKKEFGILVPNQSDLCDIIAMYPGLFPLSWLANRLQDSGGLGDWTKEFEAKTNVVTTQSQNPGNLAIQVFNERIAQRLINSANES